jgi:WD40 repeat protein
MVKDETSFTSPEAPLNGRFPECSVPSSAESGLVRSLVVVGQGVLWVVILGSLAFLYGLYLVATGATGGVLVSLFVLAAMSIFLIIIFWPCRRLAALVKYELGVAALWIGYFIGSVCLSSLVDIEWFCTIFWPWVILALVGGLLVAGPHERRTDSKMTRAVRTCALVVLVVASGLLVCGFTPLLLFENRPIATFLALKTFSLKDVAFSADGNMLATIGGCNGEERIARLRDAVTGTIKNTFREKPNKDIEFDPKCVAIQFMRTPPALTVASYSCEFGARKLAIRVWDLKNGKMQQSFQWDDDLLIRKPVFSYNSNSFAYCGKDGHVRVFDLRQGRLTIDLHRNKDNIRCLAVTPTCDALACATDERQVEIWDVVHAKEKRVVSVDGIVSSISISSDGRLLACGTEGGSVEVIDVGGARKTTTIPCFEDGAVHAVAFSPNGTMLACGGGERGLTKIVDTHRWEIIATLRTWGGWHITCLAFSPDGTRLATGDALTRVAVWDTVYLHRTYSLDSSEREEMRQTTKNTIYGLAREVDAVSKARGSLPTDEEELIAWLGKPLPFTAWGDPINYYKEKEAYFLNTLTERDCDSTIYSYSSDDKSVHTQPF